MKFLTTCCTFLALFATAQVKAAPQGFIEGHLKIVFLMAVEPDDMPEREVAPELYPAYPLVILTKEGRKEVARLTADANGNYRAASRGPKSRLRIRLAFCSRSEWIVLVRNSYPPPNRDPKSSQ